VPPTPRLLPAVAVLVAVAAIPVTAACAHTAAPAATAPAAPSRPSCQHLPEASVPNAAGSLDEASSGAYCLAVGQAVDVFLHAADPATAHWSPITSSDPEVLRAQRTGVLTAPVGVTPGIFGAQHPGTATLSSSAEAGRTWTVTIVVR
jgi:hypothetical protein